MKLENWESITLKFQKLLVCLVIIQSLVESVNDREQDNRETAREKRKKEMMQ